MHQDQRIAAFISLREEMIHISADDQEALFGRAKAQNPWFTKHFLRMAWDGIIELLEPVNLKIWARKYPPNPAQARTVGIVMAGNIPMVGFHDLLSVVISGHRAAIKMSSQDSVLIEKLLSWLINTEPQLADSLENRELLKDIDAVIATGSNNSARYFHYYFSKIPHIIRKNRTSVAVLQGHESDDDLRSLGSDIYSYFGLGCRNVSKLYLPQAYDITRLFPLWESFADLIDHNKYKNNYDYNKSILLINKEEHLDTGFSLWRESGELVSPITVVYFQKYATLNELRATLTAHKDQLQCIVGENIDGAVPFGTTQQPKVWDYADNIDTMAFLTKL